MGVLSFAQELESPISPRRLFKALMLDSHTLLPKLMPHSIDSIVFCQGHGDVGSIKQTYFSPGCLIRYATHRMDELDVENCRCKYTLIDSDIIDDQKLKMEYEAEFVTAMADASARYRASTAQTETLSSWTKTSSSEKTKPWMFTES